MDGFWKFVIDHAKDEVSAIAGAPVAFATISIVAFVLTYLIVRWHFRGVIAGKDAEIAAGRERLRHRDDLLRVKDAQLSNLQSSQPKAQHPPASPAVAVAEHTDREISLAAYARVMKAARKSEC
jgi:hypothetical protein